MCSFDVEMAIKKSERYKFPGIEQIMPDFIQ